MPRPGSSPLSRGILLTLLPWLGLGGIIPALAGNTGLLHAPRQGRTDHPRSRGEYVIGAAIGVAIAGSSPLSRGIRWLAHQGLGSTRIIPALAGNTDGRRHATGVVSDHPRSRGEYR